MRASKTELVILRLLTNNQEMYGLEMVRSGVGLKRGTIYVTLNRMIEKGIISDRPDDNPNQSGLQRRLYRINGFGQEILKAEDAYQASISLGVGGYENA